MFDFIPEELIWAFLIVVIIYLLKTILRPQKVDLPPPRPKPVYEKRDYTLEEIRKYDGLTNQNDPIFIAVKGKIYDVSSKPSMYGKDGSYNLFAGHDATVCLAKSSFEKSELNPSDEVVAALTPEQKDSLDNWFTFFSERYPFVGNVIKSESKKEN
eukprot:gene3232-4046_t